MVLHSSLSTSIKHHFGAADEVEVLQGRLARTQSPPLDESAELVEDELEELSTVVALMSC